MADDQIESFADGDQRFAAHLRERLTQLRDHTDDPELTAAIGRVLAGAGSVRELVELPAMDRIVRQGVDQAVASWEALTPEERAEQVRAGRDLLGEDEGSS
ncbi:MAG: hypothetical protein ACRDO4_17265 [Nocardioides sp.]